METLKEEVIITKDGDFVIVEEHFVTKHSKEEIKNIYANFEGKLKGVESFLSKEEIAKRKDQIKTLTKTLEEKKKFEAVLTEDTEEMKSAKKQIKGEISQLETNIVQLKMGVEGRILAQAEVDRKKIKNKLEEMKPYLA